MKLKKFLEKQVQNAKWALSDGKNTCGMPTSGLEKELKQAKQALADYMELVKQYEQVNSRYLAVSNHAKEG